MRYQYRAGLYRTTDSDGKKWETIDTALVTSVFAGCDGHLYTVRSGSSDDVYDSRFFWSTALCYRTNVEITIDYSSTNLDSSFVLQAELFGQEGLMVHIVR